MVPSPGTGGGENAGLALEIEVEGAEGQAEFAPFTPPMPVDVAMLPTDRPWYSPNRVAFCLLRVSDPRATVLFSHGNAVDIGQMAPFYAYLAHELGCNVAAYDYTGYGVSTGVPREKAQYADIRAVWRHLTVVLGIAPESIVLYGQSIGSSPSVHLAAQLSRSANTGGRPGGLVISSGIMSGIRVLRPECGRTVCFDPFQNIDKLPRVLCKTLVMHGLQDSVIPFAHGQRLHEAAANAVEPLFLPQADHDVESFPEFLPRMSRFLDEIGRPA